MGSIIYTYCNLQVVKYCVTRTTESRKKRLVLIVFTGIQQYIILYYEYYNSPVRGFWPLVCTNQTTNHTVGLPYRVSTSIVIIRIRLLFIIINMYFNRNALIIINDIIHRSFCPLVWWLTKPQQHVKI